MVANDSATKRDRGQLILIGAISIAFILLGVVVVFNSVQYTETVNNGGASDDLRDVRIVESELKTGIETLPDTSINESTIEEYVNEVYQPAQTRQRPVHVSYIDNSWDGDSFKIQYMTGDTSVTLTVEVNI